MAVWQRHSTVPSNGLPEAWVLGDLDLVRPLQLAGIPCAVVAPPGSLARRSRYVRVLEWRDPEDEPDRLLAVLIAGAQGLPERPVLLYQDDAYCSFVSCHRETLRQHFSFVMASPELVMDCLDKSRFRELARRLELRVPASEVLLPEGPAPEVMGLRYPIVIKPAVHSKDADRAPVQDERKAVGVESPAALAALWPHLVRCGSEVLAQEAVPGPESRIESYHAYRRPDGTIAGEFTGRKLRTRPVEYGQSTAVLVTEIPDVRALGREVTERMGVEGVVKLDFKRAPDDELVLLEANPRFSLWHHPGAYVGVNVPAMVWSDLTGRAVPRTLAPRPAARWMNVRDLQAAREWGVPAREWLAWAWRCEAKWFGAPDDPGPLIFYALDRTRRVVRRRLRRPAHRQT